MITLQMLSEVPKWARIRGLNDESFDILEQIALHPKRQDKLLRDRKYGEACGILLALEYAKDKGLVK